MKKVLKKIKKFILENKKNLLLGLISLVAFIIGGLAVNWVFSFIIIAIIDVLLFFGPTILNYFKGLKKNKKTVKKKTKNKKETNTKVLNTENKKKTKNSNTKNEVKNDKVKKVKTKKKSKWKWLKILLIIFFVCCILGLTCMCGFFYYIVKNAPEFDPNQLYQKESSILYDNKGVIIDKLGAQDREKITYDELPEVLVDAIIATEDSRFFQHNGFDLPRFVKAVIGQLSGNSAAGGASTLTMQVVKNTYTDANQDSGIKGIIRKFTDIYMAIFKLEKKYTKEEILEFYVNSYYMGGGAWGVEQASINYFGKNAKDLTLPEASLIAGLFQSPNNYNPFNKPEAATKRRSTVLKLMKRHGYITEEERLAADSIDIKSLLATKASEEIKYQGFIDVVVAEVKEKTGNNPYTVPMEIYTTMDRSKQDYINSIMDGTIWAWENPLVQAGISVLNTQTGEIIAVGTGRNSNSNNDVRIDYATGIKKQIGSTAKPLYDYGPAIEYNNWSTYNLLGDEPYNYTNGPEIFNWDAGYQGLITSRVALAGSRNIPALKTFQNVSNKNVKTFVTNLGLSPELEGNFVHEAHAIGGYNGESPLSLSAAYAAFANGGYYNEPRSYTKLVYRETGEVVENKQNKTRAMSEETAYMVNDMLITTATQALGYYANINGFTYAAKTGTTNFTDEIKKAKGLPDNAINDYWVAGATDEYAIAVWYGYESVTSSSHNVFGTMYHAQMFNTVAKGMFSRSTNIKMPNGVVAVTVEMGSNPAKLPSAYTPDDMKITELFKKGSEPTQVSTRFSALANPTNVDSKYEDGKVSLSWTEIKTPDALNETKMMELAKLSFTKPGYQQAYVDGLKNYNNTVLGTLGYDIYTKDESDKLTYIGTSTNKSFDYMIASTAKPITFVVKTAYANFKNNASTGVEVTVSFEGSDPITTATLNGDKTVSKNIGEIYTDESVTVYDNLVDVTNQATITISITDKDNNVIGSKISDINFDEAGEYTISYKIKYRKFNKTLTRTIIIQ